MASRGEARLCATWEQCDASSWRFVWTQASIPQLARSRVHLNLAPSDYWLISEINLPSKIKVCIQIRLICVSFTVGARFPAIPLCSSLHVAPRLVSGTNMMHKRRWKAAYEMRLWDTAASGPVVFLLSLGLLTQGKRKSQLPMWWVALWRDLLVGTWGLQPAGDAETPRKRSDDGAWLPSWWWPLGELEPELPAEALLDSQRLLVSGIVLSCWV